MLFADLRLIEPLLRAVETEGYTTPTAIQEQAIPPILDGKDLLGCAQTGTGKTAAFALPILQLLHASTPARSAAPAPESNRIRHTRNPRGPRGDGRKIRTLVLSPTRELAAQIGDSFRAYGANLPLRHTVIYGGVGQGPQCKAIRAGVDVLVATPGRLLDLMGQGVFNLRDIEILVLDEADRMLDMGFIHDIRKVIAQLPAKRQTLLFSATIPGEIRTLVNTLLHEYVTVRVDPDTRAADRVEQAVYFIDHYSKQTLLEQVLQSPDVTRALVFTRTKRGADRVARRLGKAGVTAEAIHSDKSQGARQKALDNFKRGLTPVLVASDIASRGIDVDEISHVINYDLPNEPETYIHRIGRTGRAGATGRAISFCTDEQRGELRDIERLLGSYVPALEHSIPPSPEALAAAQAPAHRAQRPGGAHRPRPAATAKTGSWGGAKRGRKLQTARPRGRRG